mgnify:CR=1 FL=1
MEAEVQAAFHPGNQKILVVDDNAANLDVMLQLLEPLGYELAIATSGEKALRVADHFRPDLVLLDVMMPGMDGYEVCRQLKAEPATRDIPVVFVTGHSSEAEREQGLAMGAAAYLSKPVDPAALYSTVEELLA